MLYANGCSFTYGTGLADKKTSWPFELSELLGLDREKTLNEGISGVSNHYIVRSTIKTLSDLLADGEKPFVAIGLTSPSRREHFIEDKNLLIHNIPSPSYHGNIRLTTEENTDLDQYNTIYMNNFWSPTYDFHNYMTNIITLQNFFKYAGLEYIIFNSLNLTPNLVEPTKFTEVCEQADMVNVAKQLDMSSIYEEQTFFTYMYDNDAFFEDENDNRYMHPNLEAHEDWAKIIFDDIVRTREGNG
jgi:hypothetical protein|tara:strand:+ start:3828 stop:4559 length:732 start_codon:yes stop_codon:yes gene_type:complete